jgi:hypothetical protein
MFLGPCAIGTLDTDGRFTSEFQDAVAAAMTALESDLAGGPAVSAGWTGFEGLCLASPTLDLAIVATQYRVGRGVDTQRRRRQKVAESYIHGSLT